jgi:transcriptional regulator with XRE-family HTH domain
MSGDTRMSELGTFLKARRGELSPRQAGLVETPGPRRVPGLRREEVAALASISTDYYTRVEQGRIRVSAPVLTVLADVLQLDDDQRSYLVSLSGKQEVRVPRRARQKVLPQLRRLLDDLGTTPAVVMGRRMDILAWNDLAAAMMLDFAEVPEPRRNYVRLLFTDPRMRSLCLDWDTLVKADDAEQQLVVWTAAEGSPTHQALQRLGGQG